MRDVARRCAVAVVVAVALALAACATTSAGRPADAAPVDRLLRLVKARLDVAPDVARAKWNSKAPIEDVVREARVIETVASQAADHGLAGNRAESFFRAQIEASKVVQRALHDEWQARRLPAFPTVADLERDVRPVLDRLTPELLDALAAALPSLQDPAARTWLARHSRTIVTQDPGSRDAVRTALAPLVAPPVAAR